MKPGELLRQEAKARAGAGGEWSGKLSKVAMWLKAADWLDQHWHWHWHEHENENLPEEEVAEIRSPELPSCEDLARAMRRWNTVGHNHPEPDPWEEVPESHREMWMWRAIRLLDFITEQQGGPSAGTGPYGKDKNRA